jgi:hypothetical protein
VSDKIVPISLEIGNTYKYHDNPRKGIDGSLNYHGWTCFVRLSSEMEYLASYIFNSVSFMFETSKEKYGKSVKAESLREPQKFMISFAGPFVSNVRVTIKFTKRTGINSLFIEDYILNMG